MIGESWCRIFLYFSILLHRDENSKKKEIILKRRFVFGKKNFWLFFFNLVNLENKMFFFIYLKRRCKDKKIAKYWIYWEYFSILFFFICYIEKILFGYWNLWTWFVKFSFWKKIQVKIYHFILRKFWIIIME